MKINRTLTINGQAVENFFQGKLIIDENQELILKDCQTGIIIPVSKSVINDFLKTTTLINLVFHKPFSIVENEAGEFIKLIEFHSPEFQKLINQSTFRTDKIKQGTLVKLVNEDQMIFISTIRTINKYYLDEFLNMPNSGGFYDKNKFLKKFHTENLFYNIKEQSFISFEAKESMFRVKDCYDIVPEYSENKFKVSSIDFSLLKLKSIESINFSLLVSNTLSSRIVYDDLHKRNEHYSYLYFLNKNEINNLLQLMD